MSVTILIQFFFYPFQIIECSAGCNEQRKIRLKINKVHSNMFLPDEDLFSAPETLLMSPPPSELPKPSLDLLAAPSCKDQVSNDNR